MFVDKEDLSEPHRQQPLDMVDIEDQFMEGKFFDPQIESSL